MVRFAPTASVVWGIVLCVVLWCAMECSIAQTTPAAPTVPSSTASPGIDVVPPSLPLPPDATLVVMPEQGAYATLPKQIMTFDTPHVPYTHTGSLRTLNTGCIGPWDLTSAVPEQFGLAMGFATPGFERDLGEMMAFGGKVYLQPTGPEGVLPVQRMVQPFSTAYVTGIPGPAFSAIDVFPRAFRLESPAPMPFPQAVDQLARATGGPCLILGWTTAPEVEGVAFRKAPIHGESLTGEKRPEYLATSRLSNVNLVFLAVAFPDVSLTTPEYALSCQVLDPSDMEVGGTRYYAHAAVVTQEPPPNFYTSPMLLSDLKQVEVKSLLHFAPESVGTTIQRGTFIVYRLQPEPTW
jgi:hypothetical protein